MKNSCRKDDLVQLIQRAFGKVAFSELALPRRTLPSSPFVFLLATISLLLSPQPCRAFTTTDTTEYTWRAEASRPPGFLRPIYAFADPSSSAETVLDASGGESATLTLTRPWGGIYGQSCRELVESRNGYLALDLDDPGNDRTNDCLPAVPSQSDNDYTHIYVAHQELIFNEPTSRITYEYRDQAPQLNDKGGVHIITWGDVAHASAPSLSTSFQVLLFDDFDIVFQFQGVLNSGSFTTGIQNSDATLGLQIACNCALVPQHPPSSPLFASLSTAQTGPL